MQNPFHFHFWRIKFYKIKLFMFIIQEENLLI